MIYELLEAGEDGMFGPFLGPHGCQNDLVLYTAIQLKTIVFIVFKTKYIEQNSKESSKESTTETPTIYMICFK